MRFLQRAAHSAWLWAARVRGASPMAATVSWLRRRGESDGPRSALRIAGVLAGLALLAWYGQRPAAEAHALGPRLGERSDEEPSDAGSHLALDAGKPGIPIPCTTGNLDRRSADTPVDLNLATNEDLRRLPGIGPKRAEAILALRSRLGHFRRLEELMKVKGIGRRSLARLKPLVRIEGSPSDAGALAPTTSK